MSFELLSTNRKTDIPIETQHSSLQCFGHQDLCDWMHVPCNSETETETGVCSLSVTSQLEELTDWGDALQEKIYVDFHRRHQLEHITDHK